jgi:hypothetical protein
MTTTNVQRGWRWPWTPDQLDAWLAKSRGSQGLPFFIEDPAVIARLLALEKTVNRARTLGPTSPTTTSPKPHDKRDRQP